MINSLLLLSKNDIPFIEAEIAIHQPTIKEIAYIGEEQFYTGCNLLNFSKELFLSTEDRENVQNKSNFDILLSLISDNSSIELKKCRISVVMVLSLIFPEYKILFSKNAIFLQSFKENEKDSTKSLNGKNFEKFKEILQQMFCLKEDGKEESYNPQGPMAQRIVKQLEERHRKMAIQSGLSDDKKVNILSRYISILSVGEHKDMNSLLNYSVYQLFDEFKRFKLNEEFNIYMQAKMAGAKDLKEPDDWMKDIHQL